MSKKETLVKIIRYFTYGLLAAVPLIYFPSGMYPFQIIKTTVFQGGVEIIFALWLALALFYKEYRPRVTPIFASLVIFLGVVSLSAILGADWRMSLFSDEQRTLGLVALFHLFGFWLVLSSLREEIHWRNVFLASIGAAVLVSLVGITQLFLVLKQGSSSPWLYILFQGPATRVGSTFSNSAFFAGYLLFNFFLALWLAFSFWMERGSRGVLPWISFLAALIILVAIFLSQTLGVILGLGAGICVLFGYFSIFRDSRFALLKKISLAVLIALLVFGGFLYGTRANAFWQKVPGLNRVAAFSFENLSVSTRLMTWNVALKAFRDRPVLGWGFENFRIGYNKYYDPKMFTVGITGTYWDKPHNVLLEYLATTGVLGLLAYLGVFGAVAFAFIRILKGAYFFEAPIIGALIVAYFIQNLVVFDTIGTYLMFFLALAYIDSRYKDVAGANEKSLKPAVSFLGFPFGAALGSILVIVLVPLYFNYQIFAASRLEYNGANYLLNSLPESSLVAFSEALTIPTPYKDDIRKNFASTVGQAYKQGIYYPGLDELHKRLIDKLREVIKNHPNDFFNYVALADFLNIFYKFDASYPEEAESLSLRALELSPRRQQVYYVLAATRFAKGDVEGAYKTFEEVITLNPEAGDSHFFYGLMAYGIGDVKKGRTEIARARELGRKPRSAGETMLLGDFVADKEKNYKEAIALYRLALGQASSVYGDVREQAILQANLKLAVAYYFDGDKEQSAFHFRKVQKSVNLKDLPIYPQLQPILKELKVE